MTVTWWLQSTRNIIYPSSLSIKKITQKQNIDFFCPNILSGVLFFSSINWFVDLKLLTWKLNQSSLWDLFSPCLSAAMILVKRWKWYTFLTHGSWKMNKYMIYSRNCIKVASTFIRWSRSRGGPQRWSEGWSNSAVRTGWGSWGCSAWRREGSGVTLEQPSSTFRGLQEGWRGAFHKGV